MGETPTLGARVSPTCLEGCGVGQAHSGISVAASLGKLLNVKTSHALSVLIFGICERCGRLLFETAALPIEGESGPLGARVLIISVSRVFHRQLLSFFSRPYKQ